MQMRNQLKDSLKTPEEERYSGKITRHDHFDDLTDIDNALNKVPEHLAVEERRRYTESCFGHLLRMDRGMKFSAGIVHRLLIRELHHDGPEDEMRFLLGRHSVRFSKVEFCLITGLKFGELPDTSTYDMVENGIHQRRSIYGFKHALDGRSRRFEQRQRRKGVDVHTTETYNIYGLMHALLIFARVKLVPTATERAERYFEGISQGGSLYDVDLGDISVPVSDPERYTTAGTSYTEGLSFEPSDTEGSDSDGRHIRLARTRRVRFTLPREPQTRDDSRTGDDSRGGVRGQAEDRRYTELMDALRELQEEVRKSNEKRDQQHQELLDLIRGLQGSTSHARTRGTRFDDPPFYDPDGHRDFSPRGRTGSHLSDQQGPGVTPRDEVTRGTSGTDTAPMEIEEEPQQVLPDQSVHSQELRTPTGYTGGHSPSTHRTSGGNTRGQSSSLQLSHPVDHIELDWITPPLQRQNRVCRAGWQQRTPYTDPSLPKRPRIRPQPAHVWAPHALIDPDHLAAYQAYKRNSTGELRDVDLLEPVGVPWFHRFQTNIMELEDTHMDAYLHILRKRQRYYSTVYGPRINIQDSQFYSWLLNDWERLMGSGADKPRRSWSMFKHQWSAEDLAVVLGLVPVGTKPWNEVDVVLIPGNLGRTHWALASVDLTTGSIYLMDPFRQESWLLNDWERLMGSGADKPRRSWSMFKHQWSAEDLAVVLGLVPAGTKPWNEVDVVLIPGNLGRTHWALASVDLTTGSIYLMDPFRQESWLLNDWERLMGSGADKPHRSWSMFKHQWSAEDLAVVLGLVPAGTKPWNKVDVVLIPCNLGRTHWALASVDLTTGSIYLMDPFRQEVPFSHRKTQLACLRYFLPSMLHAVDFHSRRRRGDMTYTLQNKPFPLNIVSRDRVPQQDRGGNCGAHTLRLIEYLVANMDTFDWSENEMGTI
ncbi:hypothetical protein LWI28_004952 [Acer negundo]|uniref:Ubiquitin-like protease family profile domain-containing protein n=1 Tax=Acer negundo TaxID=4023 RepID=A0AAD5NEB5_ACENE|nr:hypothetical protein LWI28_004952 [Acer negundo]